MTVLFYKTGDEFSFTKKNEASIPLFYELFCKGRTLASKPTLEECIKAYEENETVFIGNFGVKKEFDWNPVAINCGRKGATIITHLTDNRVTLGYICPHCGYMWSHSYSSDKYTDKEIDEKAGEPEVCPECGETSVAVSVRR